MDMCLTKLREMVKDRKAWRTASMRLHRVGHNLAPEQQQTSLNFIFFLSMKWGFNNHNLSYQAAEKWMRLCKLTWFCYYMHVCMAVFITSQEFLQFEDILLQSWYWIDIGLSSGWMHGTYSLSLLSECVIQLQRACLYSTDIPTNCKGRNHEL